MENLTSKEWKIIAELLMKHKLETKLNLSNYNNLVKKVKTKIKNS